MVSIPASKLLVFTNDKEWDNYEWVSILRSAYKHWFYKDNFYKFDSIRQERLSVGIPVMYTPWALWDEDKANVEKIVSNIRTTSQTGIVMPWKKEDWWLFEFADTKSSGDTKIYERNIKECISTVFRVMKYRELITGFRWEPVFNVFKCTWSNS